MKEGDKSFVKHRGALLAPFKARLYWDEWERRRVTDDLVGRLKGNAYFLGKKMGYAEMTVFSRPNGTMRIVSKGNGKFQNLKATPLG